jgi:hypothetical protein
VGRQAGSEEAHGERLGKSCEGLTAGPHAEVSEIEEKLAADTWDREGAGVHLVVAHKERESRGAGLRCDASRVRSSPFRKRKGFLNLIHIFPTT